MERDKHSGRSQAVASTASLAQLLAALCRERPAAEETLGRRLIDPYAFAADCISDGLGHALNAEQDRIDLLGQLLPPRN